MASPAPPDSPNLSPDFGPELRALLNELEETAESLQTEYQAHISSPEAMKMADVSSTEVPSIPPPPDPAELRAELAKIEEASLERSEHAFHGAELSHQIMHTAENVTEQIFEHRHHGETPKELQWFYAKGSERAGPVTQSELVHLLDKGDLEWSTLVWNKKLEDWAKASQTELLNLAKGPEPPPLPPPLPSVKKQPTKEQKCRGCGRVNGPNDRFCAGCGKPLRLGRK